MISALLFNSALVINPLCPRQRTNSSNPRRTQVRPYPVLRPGDKFQDQHKAGRVTTLGCTGYKRTSLPESQVNTFKIRLISPLKTCYKIGYDFVCLLKEEI